jgi:hypothetical protein
MSLEGKARRAVCTLMRTLTGLLLIGALGSICGGIIVIIILAFIWILGLLGISITTFMAGAFILLLIALAVMMLMVFNDVGKDVFDHYNIKFCKRK